MLNRIARCFAVVAASMLAGAAAAQDAGPAQPEVAQPEAAKAAPATTPLGHVEKRGEGPVAMVLIPGLAMDWSVYESFMDRNKERYTMFAVTLPGFGGSEPPPQPEEEGKYSQGAWLENAERAIVQMIEERGIEKPVLLGQSLGGHVALRLVAEHPERFGAAVILQSMPAYPIDGPEAEVTREARTRKIDEFLHEQVKHVPDDEWLKQQQEWLNSLTANEALVTAMVERSAELPKSTSSRYMLEYLGGDVQKDLAESRTPILVIAGIPDEPGADLDALRGMWPALYEGVPRVTIVFFEETRELILAEAPEALDRAVVQFLAGRPVEGKPARTPADVPIEEPKAEAPVQEPPRQREPRAEPRTPHLPPEGSPSPPR